MPPSLRQLTSTNRRRAPAWRLALAAVLLGAGVAAPAGPLAAQDGTGTLLVRVRRPDSTPLPGAFVRAGRIAAVTDAAGLARVELPATLISVVVSHPAYESQSFEMTIVASVSQEADVVLRALPPARGAAAVGVTRTGGRLADDPVPIDLLAGDDLADETQSHPTDLTQLLGRMRGVRPQTLTGALDATRARIRGLGGQYTALLLDGMPLLGGRAESYALRQVSPMEVGQVEVVKGASTALHGPAAAGGVINLVSRPADRNAARLAVAQSSERGGDVMFWGSRRASPTLGATIFGDFHQQRLVDPDDDQWGEFPRAIRLSVRPRLHLDRPNGDGLTATAGAFTEDRTGGFLLTNLDPNPYREELRTRRFDGAVTARRMTSDGGGWQLRLAASSRSVRHQFGSVLERDRRSTLFGDLTYTRSARSASVVAGVAYQRDALRQRDLPEFDYTHSVPSGFVQVTVASPSARVTGTAIGRCDRHNVHGLQCTPQIAVLLRPSATLDARLSGGLGYVAPTPLTDDVEALGLHAIIPVGARAERTLTAALDLTWKRDALELGGTLAFTRLTNAARLIPFAGDTLRRLRFITVTEPTRIVSLDLVAVYRADPLMATAFYSWVDGSEGIPGQTGRREIDFTPRHALGAELSWRSPGASGTWVSLEASYSGRQFVWDNPRRTETPGYTLVHATVSQRTGRARVFLSGENLFDVKLTDYEPVLLPAPVEGGRRTAGPWVPLRGRVLSLGALVDW